jgi:hypothetical protein
MSLFSQLVSAYKNFGYSGQQAQNIAAVQIVGEGAGLGSGGADAASGGSNGISQWSSTRWAQEQAWASGQGLDPRSVAGEAGFTNYELQHGYSGVNTNSVSDIVNNYESPQQSLRAGEIARSQAAAGLGSDPSSLDKLGGSSPPGGAQGGSTPKGGAPGGSSPATGDTSTGTPVNITDPRAIANTGLDTASKAVTDMTAGLTKDTAAVTAAGDTWMNMLGNLLSGGTGIFARVGVGLLALALVGIALFMMSNSREGASL